jgi:hypothetical protein
METQPKPKKVLTQEMLDNLSKAREKAKKKREEMGELTRLKKAVAEKKQAELVLNLKQELGSETVAPVSQPDEDSEPEVLVKKKTKKKPIVIVEQSDSDSEDEQVVYIKRKSNRPAPVPVPEPVPVPVPEPPRSIYTGMHPSMLLGRRF